MLIRMHSLYVCTAPLEEVEYTSREQLEGMQSDGKANQDLHRQLLNLPLASEGSHDSHNDSGYSTRMGFSAGPSPSLSGNPCHEMTMRTFVQCLPS